MTLQITDNFIVNRLNKDYKIDYGSIISDLETDLDPKYVLVSGDNMTGDLTLGPVNEIKISLKADGSADFISTITQPSSDPKIKTVLYAPSSTQPGTISIDTTSTAISADPERVVYSIYNPNQTSLSNYHHMVGLRQDGSATFRGNINVGGDVDVAPNIFLNASDGSIAASSMTLSDAGNTQIRVVRADSQPTYYVDLATVGTGSSIIANKCGQFQIDLDPTNEESGTNFQILLDGSPVQSFDDDGTSFFNYDMDIGGTHVPYAPNISLNANGSAEFAGGDLTIRDDGMLYTKGDLRVGGSDKDNPNIFLRLNGSADFAGPVQVGPSPTDGAAAGVKLYDGGTIHVGRGIGTTGVADVFRGYATGNSDATTRIASDGSAKYAGTIIAGDGSPINGANSAAAIYPTGQIGLSRASDGNCLTVYKTTENTAKVLIRNDGAVETIGTVKIGPETRNLSSTETANIKLSADGSANFADQVIIGQDDENITLIPGSSGVGSGVGINGRNISDPTREALAIQDTTSTNINKVKFNWDGSGSFVGGVGIGTDGHFSSPSAPNISLNADGSAKFAGGRTNLNADGSIDSYRSSGDGASDLQAWSSDIGGTQLVKARFRADGTLRIGGLTDSTNNSPNIELNAINSSAILKGTAGRDITINASSIDEQLVINTQYSGDPTGRVFFKCGYNGSERFRIDHKGSTYIGGIPASAPNITLNANGSSTFAGNVMAGNYQSAGIGAGTILGANGNISINSNTGGGQALTINNASGATDKIVLNRDGSAEFQGNVLIGGQLPNLPNISLNADGSAEFSSGVTAGTFSAAINFTDALPARSDSLNNTSRQIRAFNPDDSANYSAIVLRTRTTNASNWMLANEWVANNKGDLHFIGRTTSSNNVIALKLTSDGSATFASSVTIEDPSRGGPTISLGDSGLVEVFRNTTNANNGLMRLYSNVGTNRAEKVTILSDGSATFVGTVTADNVTFNLEADDDTKYTATTDSEGTETLVYNGAVLNVKELLVSLQTAAARIEALEARLDAAGV